jgi:hypothetical protein
MRPIRWIRMLAPLAALIVAALPGGRATADAVPTVLALVAPDGVSARPASQAPSVTIVTPSNATWWPAQR